MRRKVLVVLSCVIMLLCGLRAVGACEIGADSQYEIVVPDSYSNAGVEPLLRMVATELATAFRETLGMKPTIVHEKDAKAPHRIYLGDTAAIRAIGIKPADFQNYDCVIAERKGNIFLAGNDHERFGSKTPTNNQYRYILGTVKAVVIFMEDYLDTRFLMPGSGGIDYATQKTVVSIPDGLTRSIKPSLVFATGRHYGLLYDYSTNNYGQGAFYSYGGHSYYNAVPAKKYADSHPEYFAMSGGKRNPHGNHLCISNPEVQELIYAEALRRLDNGAQYVQVAQTDGYKACACPKCKAFAGTDDEGEKLWVLHRSFAVRLLKDRPGKNLHIISYGPTAAPPKSFDSFPPNVVIELCNYSKANFERWSHIAVPGGFTVYIYNWGWYQKVGITPKTTTDFCAEQVRLFLGKNVRGVYRCGFGELFGLEGPSYYVFGKTFDKPDLNPEAMLSEYCVRAFGEKASAPMNSFYNLLYERMKCEYLLPYVTSLETGTNWMPSNPRIVLGAIYTPELLELLNRHLATAEKLTVTDKQAARLGLVRREFDYVRNLGNIISLYNAYRVNPNKANFLQLADLIDERNAMIDSFYNDKGHMKPVPGLPAVRFLGGIGKNVLRVNGRLGAPLSAPFTWNTASLRKSGLLPGSAVRSMDVFRAASTPGDDFEAGAWAAARWQLLNGIQLGDVRTKSRFKALYDKDNLYFALESDVLPGVKYKACGHDGTCWQQDCLELTINPVPTSRGFYHFIINPLPESFYEAAHGMIKDPLHPLYNKEDTSWDGSWTYSSRVEGTKWSAFIIIPFTSLGGKAPATGEQWTWNVGREAFFRDDKSDIELSLWSPNLECMSFQDVDAFGKVNFK